MCASTTFKFFSAYFIYSLAIRDNSDKFAILCIFRKKKKLVCIIHLD